MKIAFASGKGDTGKTTVVVNPAYFLACSGQHVQYLDCDAEEPNGHIFPKPDLDAKRGHKSRQRQSSILTGTVKPARRYG